MPDAAPPARSRRTLALRIGVPVALVVAGVVLEVAVGGVAGIIGAGLIGVAAVLALANLFYEVGRSEDRERARSAARPVPPEAPPSNGRVHADAGPTSRAGGRTKRPEPPRDWPPRGRRGSHD